MAFPYFYEGEKIMYIAVIIPLLTLLVGGLSFRLLLGWFTSRVATQRHKDVQDILSEGKKQAEDIAIKDQACIEEENQRLTDILEEDLTQLREDIQFADNEVNLRAINLKEQEFRLSKEGEELKCKQSLLEERKLAFKKTELISQQQALKTSQKLASILCLTPKKMTIELSESYIEKSKLTYQKSKKYLFDELDITSDKKALRLLQRIGSRYQPKFIWPKTSNYVEITNTVFLDYLQSDHSFFLEELKKLSGVDIKFDHNANVSQPILRLYGGLGVAKEAAKMTIFDMLEFSKAEWKKVSKRFMYHRNLLEQQAIALGKKAVEHLHLHDIHPEIQKLVGYLNWRTSYRQNQWFHSVEVAHFSGLLAGELGISSEDAKRCGLLHDIGKAIDYSIERSHAWISSDYANRFGETKMICDTVLSHHDEIILETPLAYILKAADTMSGARPGSRVNIEEEYQIRLNAIHAVVQRFPGIINSAIMNGGREVRVEVHHASYTDQQLSKLSQSITKKITDEVAFPGFIKILVIRRFEATAVA